MLARPVILQDPRARLLVRRHVGPLVNGSSSPLQQKSLLSSIYSRSGRIFYRSRGFSVAIDQTLPALFSVLYNLRAHPNTSSHRGMGESATAEYSFGCRCQCLSRATVALPPMTSLTGTSWPRWVAHIGSPGPARLQQGLYQTRGGRRSRRNCSAGNSSAAGRLTSWPGNSMCRIPVRSRPPYTPSSPPHNGSVELKNGAWAWWTRSRGHGAAACAGAPPRRTGVRQKNGAGR
jgi:hypothetical protein